MRSVTVPHNPNPLPARRKHSPPTPNPSAPTLNRYLVRVVKHIFKDHVVLQFNVTNTLNDQLLTDVQVVLEEQDADMWEVQAVVPAPRVPFDVTKQTFVCLRRPADEGYPSTPFTSELRFKVQDVDPATGEPDEDDEGRVWQLTQYH